MLTVPKVVIYGKKGCKLCDSAKEKMKILGIPYSFYDLLEPPSNWRETSVATARAYYEDMEEQTLPIIEVDGKLMLYPESMKLLKSITKVKKEEAEKVVSILDVLPVRNIGEGRLAFG